MERGRSSVTPFLALRMDAIDKIIVMAFPPSRLVLVITCPEVEIVEDPIGEGVVFKNHQLGDY